MVEKQHLAAMVKGRRVMLAHSLRSLSVFRGLNTDGGAERLVEESYSGPDSQEAERKEEPGREITFQATPTVAPEQALPPNSKPPVLPQVQSPSQWVCEALGRWSRCKQ